MIILFGNHVKEKLEHHTGEGFKLQEYSNVPAEKDASETMPYKSCGLFANRFIKYLTNRFHLKSDLWNIILYS